MVYCEGSNCNKRNTCRHHIPESMESTNADSIKIYEYIDYSTYGLGGFNKNGGMMCGNNSACYSLYIPIDKLDRKIKIPETIVVRSQEELDNISAEFQGFIIIEFGDERLEAEIKKRYYNAIIKVFGNTHAFSRVSNIIEAHDESTVTVQNESVVYAYSKSFIRAMKNSYIISRGNSTIYANDNSRIYAYGKSKVYAYNKSIVSSYDESETFLFDNSSITLRKGSIIHICSDDISIQTESSN